MTQHDAFLDDAAMLALGMLSEGEAAAVRAHIAQCAECSAEYRRFLSVVGMLALAAADPTAPAVPGRRLKKRLMTQVQPRKQAPVLAYALAAACLIAAIVLGVLYGSLVHRNGAMQAQLRRERTALSDVLSPSAQRYTVSGGEVVRHGPVVYLALRNLRALPHGKSYQAWTLPKGSKKMAPSITFRAQGQLTLIRLPVQGSRIAAVAVSVEPSGGSSQPTTKPLFVAKLE